MKTLLNLIDLANYEVKGETGRARHLLYTRNRNLIARYVREGIDGRKLKAKFYPGLISNIGDRYAVELKDALAFRKYIEQKTKEKRAAALGKTKGG